MRLGALRAALAAKLSDGTLIVVDKLDAGDSKTKTTAEMFKTLGATGKTLVIDVTHDDGFTRVGAQHRRREAGAERPRHRARRDGHRRGGGDARALEKLQEALG